MYEKNIIVTKYFFDILSSYHKNQLWSQNFLFAKLFSDILKMDIYKCPKWENQNTFGKIILDHTNSHRFLQNFYKPLW